MFGSADVPPTGFAHGGYGHARKRHRQSLPWGLCQHSSHSEDVWCGDNSRESSPPQPKQLAPASAVGEPGQESVLTLVGRFSAGTFSRENKASGLCRKLPTLTRSISRSRSSTSVRAWFSCLTCFAPSCRRTWSSPCSLVDRYCMASSTNVSSSGSNL